MNYYSPYYLMTPSYPSSGIFNLFRGSSINLSTILNGTQKVLNLANQALPLIKEAAPMMRNAKTMFKVMSEFKKLDAPKKDVKDDLPNTATTYNKTTHSYSNGPTFFA